MILCLHFLPVCVCVCVLFASSLARVGLLVVVGARVAGVDAIDGVGFNSWRR